MGHGATISAPCRDSEPMSKPDKQSEAESSLKLSCAQEAPVRNGALPECLGRQCLEEQVSQEYGTFSWCSRAISSICLEMLHGTVCA